MAAQKASAPAPSDWSGGSQWGLGLNPAGPSMNQVTLDTPIVGSRPAGSIVGSYGSSGTTYLDPKTGAVVGFKPGPGQRMAPQAQMTGGGFGGGFGGGGAGGGGFGGGAAAPVEFYLGPAPTLPQLNFPELKLPGAPVIPNLQLPGAPQLAGVDYAGVMSQFRSTFNMLNTGINPQFGVDVNKIAADAKEVAGKLNLSPQQIKQLVAGINPTTGEILADVEEISRKVNDPAKISAAAEKLAAGLNQKYQSAFNAAMPGYTANMAKANELTSSYLSGKLPQDVVDAVYRGAAAKGFTAGIFGGGIGRNLVAKDLGLTSLQLQSAGANLLQQTAQLASSVIQATMPVSGESFARGMMTDPNQIFSSVMNMNRVDPTSVFNAVYTPTRQVFEQMSSMAQQSTMAKASFEASKMIAPSVVFDTLTKQALYNQQINMQNALNSWETGKTMALQNNQIAEKNALNSWQARLSEAQQNYQTQIAQAQYNQQIQSQNLINAWQSQALPGQFDIRRGQYVSYTPGQYQSTRPTIPGMPEAPSSFQAGGQTYAAQDPARAAFDLRRQLERNYFRSYRV